MFIQLCFFVVIICGVVQTRFYVMMFRSEPNRGKCTVSIDEHTHFPVTSSEYDQMVLKVLMLTMYCTNRINFMIYRVQCPLVGTVLY